MMMMMMGRRQLTAQHLKSPALTLLWQKRLMPSSRHLLRFLLLPPPTAMLRFPRLTQDFGVAGPSGSS